MKILVDETRLSLLLEKKKQFIGKRVVWDSILSSISFLISVFLASYNDIGFISGIVLKTIFVLLGLFFQGRAFTMYIGVRKICIRMKIFTMI